MGRKYPRFLYCESIDSKTQGPFVIHTYPPRIIAKLEFDKKRRITNADILDNWENATLEERWKVQEEISEWFYTAGRIYSDHPKDKILSQLNSLKFLANYSEHYTIEQAEDIVRICFPTKTKKINESHSSYGLKHLLERISELHTEKGARKYCSNDTMKIAFERQGFAFEPDGPNCFYNISERDFKNIDELTHR